MKQAFLSFLSLVLFLSFTGCEERSVIGEAVSVVENDIPETEELGSASTLVVYFTMPESDGVDALAGASRVVENGAVLGNTQWVADRIFEMTSGSLFAIETVQSYPGNHEALVDQGAVEKRNGARPELRTHIDNWDEYDVIYLGYPIWWDDLPMPLYSFLEEYDFSGKKIIPFSSHGGSRLAGTVETLKRELPDSEVVENAFTVSRNSILESRDDIVAWLDEMG